MRRTNSPGLRRNARNLRSGMTKEERHLWYDFLRELPVNVYRQKVIGRYIVDFYIASSKIVIELDGSQHYDEEGRKKDIERDEFLKRMGIKVLRYSNYDVNVHFEAVCEDILNNIAEDRGGFPLFKGEAVSPEG